MGEIDWLAVGIAVLGMLVTTGGGLLSLVSDPERPARFVPVYLVAITLFCGGLAMVLWCETAGDWVRTQTNPPAKETSTT